MYDDGKNDGDDDDYDGANAAAADDDKNYDDYDHDKGHSEVNNYEGETKKTSTTKVPQQCDNKS